MKLLEALHKSLENKGNNGAAYLVLDGEIYMAMWQGIWIGVTKGVDWTYVHELKEFGVLHDEVEHPQTMKDNPDKEFRWEPMRDMEHFVDLLGLVYGKEAQIEFIELKNKKE